MSVSVGDVAGLVAAVAFVLLVGALAVPLIKLGGVLDEARKSVKTLSDETVPLINETTNTVTEVTAAVSTANAQLVKVDAITSNVQAATTNVSALTALLAATLGNPVIKVAAFSYAVRSALTETPKERRARQVAATERARAASARAEGHRRRR